MPVAGEDDKRIYILRRQFSLVDVVQNNEIGEVFFNPRGVAGVDNAVCVRAYPSDLFGKRAVGEVGKEGDFDQIDLRVQLLEPALDVRLYAEVSFERYVPMLVIDERDRFRQSVVKINRARRTAPVLSL